MAHFIRITEKDGKEWLLNLDKVNRIIPVSNVMQDDCCNIYLDDSNGEDGDVPITINISYTDLKSIISI